MPRQAPAWSLPFLLGVFFDRFAPDPSPAVAPVTCDCWCDCEGTGKAGLAFYAFLGALALLAVQGVALGGYLWWCRWVPASASGEASSPLPRRYLVQAARAAERLRASTE